MYPKFTQRDKDILFDVYAYRYLSSSQIGVCSGYV
jgi:hypothetical protein